MDINVKVTFTAPSAEGLSGNTEHKSWTYLTAKSEKELDNIIEGVLTDFVMKTGVNKDMVTIVKEYDNDTGESNSGS